MATIDENTKGVELPEKVTKICVASPPPESGAPGEVTAIIKKKGNKKKKGGRSTGSKGTTGNNVLVTQQQKLTDKESSAFMAILAFVKDLWDVFGDASKVDPLAMYNRLLRKITFNDTEQVRRAIRGFNTFYTTYDFSKADAADKLPPNTKILYGDNLRIYIDIQNFLRLSNGQSKDAIKQHLVFINTKLEVDASKAKNLEDLVKKMKLEEKSPEGDFLTSILTKTQDTMKDVDTENPMAAIATLMSSGVLTDLVSGIQKGMENGNFDMSKMMQSMTSVMSSLTTKPSSVVEEKN